METKLRDLSIELHEGRGFFVISGLSSEDFSAEDNVLVFLGISSYVGNRIGTQDRDQHVFGKLYTLYLY